MKEPRNSNVLWALSTVAILLFMMFLPSVSNPAKAQFEQEPVAQELFPDQYVDFKINMKEGKTFTPEGYMETDTDDHKILCPSGYVADGLFGFGIIKRLGHVYWMKVAQWKSDDLYSDMMFKEKITYAVYVSGEYSTSGDFAFTMLHNGNPIGHKPDDPGNWTVVSNAKIPADTPTLVTAEEKINLNQTQTDIEPGDAIGVEIWCRLQGTVHLHYGSMMYPSHVKVKANSIRFNSLGLTKKKATVSYRDAFGTYPLQIKSAVSVDGAELQLEPEPNPVEGYQGIVWKFVDTILPGSHVLVVGLAYDKNANTTAMFEASKTISINEGEMAFSIPFADILIPLLGLIIVLVAVALIWRYYQNKKLEEEMAAEYGENYQDYEGYYDIETGT